MNVFRFRFLFRQKRILIFLFIVIMLFLMNQIISVGQLGKELSKSNRRPKLQTNFRSYEKADGFMESRHVEKEVNHAKPEAEGLTSFVIGVLPSSQKYYKPTADNKFRCIHSGEEINFKFLNDNFCDCSDFSDEPSTSACSSGRFYCTYQSNQHISSISSYKVNDGICDCCDGSDEWLRVALPEHTVVPVSKQKGIFQTPCSLHCIS